MSKNTTTTATTTTTNTTNTTDIGNTKYQVNGINHGYSHCLIDTTNGFIVAYGNKDNIEAIKACYNCDNFVAVDMLGNTKVQSKIAKKAAERKAKLQAQLDKLQSLVTE